MTPEAQRIAIAEACGRCIFKGTGIREYRAGTVSEFCVKCGNPFGYHELPDYLNDLNAMHEAEKTLSGAQWCEFCRQLGIIERCYEDISKAIHATADQRAEAFLRTLGKWADE